jgi:two-component system, NtrC family, sensor kinase
MRLARKLTFYLVAGILAILTLWAALAVQREVRLFETDMVRDHELLARAMATAYTRVWRIDGREHAIELLKRVNAGESPVRVRFVPRDMAAREIHLSPGERDRVLNSDAAVHYKFETGDPILYTYVAVRPGTEAEGAIELKESLAPRDAYVRTTVLRASVTALSLALLCSLLALTLGTRLVGRPVRALVDQARRIGAGDLSTRLDVSQEDEIGDLALEMNAMSAKLAEANRRLLDETAARIHTLEQLRHADRLVTVGKLASGIAHELGTPLNVVSGRAKMIVKSAGTSEQTVQNARVVMEQSERMARIIRQLLDFARAGDSHKAEIDVKSLTLQTLGLLEPIARKAGVDLHLTSSDPLPRLAADAAQVQQVMTNLIVNAVQAMRAPGRVEIVIDVRRALRKGEWPDPAADYVCIEVEDHGSGMSEATLERIFEPFFTTKDVGEGTGLGLSVAYGIVDEHGGFIEVESTLAQGSRFRVYLPLSNNSTQAA